jgi:hypothetical protein
MGDARRVHNTRKMRERSFSLLFCVYSTIYVQYSTTVRYSTSTTYYLLEVYVLSTRLERESCKNLKPGYKKRTHPQKSALVVHTKL